MILSALIAMMIHLLIFSTIISKLKYSKYSMRKWHTIIIKIQFWCHKWAHSLLDVYIQIQRLGMWSDIILDASVRVFLDDINI